MKTYWSCLWMVLGDEPWVRTVIAGSQVGDVVMLTWDEVARSASFRWRRNGHDLVVMEREYVSEIAVHDVEGQLTFPCSCEPKDSRGDSALM
jgi:hypothetical protein